mgnify:CR=1 FL=1
MEALDLLNTFVDESDPDVDMPNSFHAFQTAERIREKHPDKDWLQLTGLIHDLGKIMGLYGQEQVGLIIANKFYMYLRPFWDVHGINLLLVLFFIFGFGSASSNFD